MWGLVRQEREIRARSLLTRNCKIDLNISSEISEGTLIEKISNEILLMRTIQFYMIPVSCNEYSDKIPNQLIHVNFTEAIPLCINNFINVLYTVDRLCGLVVRVSGYRYRGPGFDPRRYQIF